MRQKLRQKAARPPTGQHVCGATPREHRGDLLGAQPGPGPRPAWRPAIQRVQVEPPAAPARGRQALPAAGGPVGGGAGWRVLRRARRGLAADCSPAIQTDCGRAGGAERGLDTARAGQVRRGEHRRRPESVRGAGRPALGCRAAPPPGWRPPRPPWCGECDKRTRMAGFYSDAPKPCPRCKPTARAQQHSPSPDGPHHLHGGPAQQASIGARAAQHRAHPVHRNDAPGAFDPDPDPVCARR
jgi:hypothetical protein